MASNAPGVGVVGIGPPSAWSWGWAWAVEGEAERDRGHIGGGGPGDCPETGRTKDEEFKACSQTHEWRTFEGGLQRVSFAFTMGAAAIVMSAILWTLSVPWVAWCLLRIAHPVVSSSPASNTLQGLSVGCISPL